MVGVPDHPPLGNLRVANLDDVMRLGIVATAGFRYSPLFRWVRAYHDSFPADTVLSYRTRNKTAINDPNSIVLVAEDEYKLDENKDTSAIIPDNDAWIPPDAGTKVVVGIAVFNLQPGSKRRGQLKDDTGTCPDLPECQNRDMNYHHYKEWIELEQEALHRNFPTFSEMAALVVHPAYWRRGHGTELVRWGQRLSVIDGVPQGVSAADMGEKLYLHLGYKCVERICKPGDEDDPEGMSTMIMLYSSL